MADNCKVLIAYFSYSGNTRAAAKEIQRNTGGECFEISTVNAYPQNYNAVVNAAKREQQANSRPELTAKVENMDAYDVVCIGYPNWWGTMPMAVFTFLEQYDFSGKTILPFCTHEGSGLGRSEKDIAKLCPTASVFKGLALRGSSVNTAQKEIADWLRNAGIKG